MERFTNAYGEEMSPNAMIQQLLHRVSKLESTAQTYKEHIGNLNTQLATLQHDNEE